MSSPNVDEPEQFNFPVGLALVIAWTLIYLCMVQGITESGKVVYVTAIFPYVVLIIFFFRGITLKGATDGIAHLFTPRWEILADPVVWLEAGTQIFFSLGEMKFENLWWAQSSVTLLSRIGIWRLDCIQFLQPREQQLLSRCAASLVH